MARGVKGLAAVVGLAVGLSVLAMSPAGTQRSTGMAEQSSHGNLVVDGSRHVADATDRMIVESRIVPATPAECWARWTTGQGVAGFMSKHNSIELRIGGPYEVYFAMQLPEGLRGSEDCRILSYLPERMLSFEWNAPPTFPEIRQERSRVVVLFEPAEGGTKVELTHLGFGRGEQWDQVYAYFTKAWPRVMDGFAMLAEA